MFSFFTNLSKEDWCNPKGEVTVVLLTPGSLQVFDGKACFGLFYIKVTNPAFKEKWKYVGSEMKKEKNI